MTKTNTASSGPVYGLSVPGCQLKKVRRRSVRLSSCSADVRQDDAPIPSTTIQGEAFQVSPPPSGAAFAPTQLPQQNVHQAMLAPNNQRTEQNSSGESVVPVAGGRTKDYCDWWREHCLEQSNLSLFNVRLIGDASSPQLFTSMAHNDLAYCRYACFLIALAQMSATILKFGSKSKAEGVLQQLFAANGVTTGYWNMRQLRCLWSWYCQYSPNKKSWNKLLLVYSVVRSACQCPMWKLFLSLTMP